MSSDGMSWFKARGFGLVVVVAVLAACKAQPAGRSDADAAEVAAPIADAGRVASINGFERLVGGEWKVTMASGEVGIHAWQWGPGRHSIRQVASLSNADADPWAGEVMYWHPGHDRVCVMSMHGDIPGVGRGITEGTMTFEGDSDFCISDLYQPPGRRKIGNRRTFDGPDKYREELLEDGGQGLQPLNSWNFVRVRDRVVTKVNKPEEASPELPAHLTFFEPLIGREWEAMCESIGVLASERAVPVVTTFKLIASLEVMFVRVSAPGKDGEATNLMEAYFYHHLGTGKVRCLALSQDGGVYEGDVTMAGERSLQIDLKGYTGERVMPMVVQLDVEADGTLRSRAWSVEGTERTVVMDCRHAKRVDPH